MNLVLNTLQVSSCIPVSAEEITSYILHKNPHRQLDQESDEEGGSVQDDASGSQMLKSPTREGARNWAWPSPQRRAERAAMRSLRGHRQYIILDCRPRQEFDSCRLAPALHLDPDLLVSPEKLDAKLKEFIPLQVDSCSGILEGKAGGVWWRAYDMTKRERERESVDWGLCSLWGRIVLVRRQRTCVITTFYTYIECISYQRLLPRFDLRFVLI